MRSAYTIRTEVDGTFQAWCPTDYYTVNSYEPRYYGDNVYMDQEGTLPTPSLSGAYCEPTSEIIDLVANPDAGHLYRQMDEIAASSASVFDIGVGLVLVRRSDRNSTDDDGNIIRIVNIYNSYGRASQAHEYGHALHARRLGGVIHVQADCNYDTTYPHPYNQVQTYRCAVGEGFASYHSALVYPAGNWLSNMIEQGVSDDGVTPLAPFGVNGALVPHAVSGFLLDLTDDTPGEEGVAYPPYYIARIMATCTAAGFRYSSVDQLIWCMEGAIDRSTYSSGFFSGLTGPAFFTENAVEPPDPNRQQNVRSQWRRNLYPWM